MPNTFKRNIVIGFGFSLLLLIISSAASFISIRNLLDSAKWVDHTHQVIVELEKVNTLLLETETNQRGYLLTGDDSFLDPMQANLAAVKEQMSVVRRLTIDNENQQKNTALLTRSVNSRLQIMNNTVRAKKIGLAISNDTLIQGKQFMDEAKTNIDAMEHEEQRLLKERTDTLNKFSNYTPILIVLAALISLVTTIVFYGKIISDYRQRAMLQDQLQQKDIDISKRIEVIQGIAEKVSQGNYSIRVDDESKDLLGSLSGSLNKMSESLDYSFKTLGDKEWLQAGVAGLSQQMVGEQDVDELVSSIINYTTEYSGSKIGALYLYNENSNELVLKSSYALTEDSGKRIGAGEGVVGQAAQQRKMLIVEGLSESNFTISTTAGDIIPSSIIAIPLLYEKSLKGVLELGTLTGYTENHRLFFESVMEQTGVAINASQSRRKLQELLEETQSQSEELQVQHSELENINEELKAQSQKLQVSEEELKVQQEELMQTNIELEERTTLLEEKNQMIEERNEEIQQKAKELAITTKYKSEFLANMSHELRTPLNSILLLSRLMSENNQENLSSEQIEYAQVIQNSGQSLLSLIDEILDLSKIEAGKMHMEFQDIAVREITNDLRSLFAPVAKEKNIDFTINIAEDVPARIETDKMRIQQILKNLISNALKFTAKGSVHLNIRKHDKNDSVIVFAVKDTGIGIPQDKQRLIFEAFQQADGSTRRQFGGTGLGLSISRELSRLLGGQIELSSEPGKGSEFRLLVPLSKPNIEEQRDTTQEILQDAMLREYRASEKTKHEPAPPSMLITQDDTPDKMSEVFHRIEKVLKNEPRKVLIIEENPVHAKALCYFLENFNIHPEIKTKVDEAVSSLLKKDQSCVILDQGVNNEQLYDSLEKIKQTPGLELLPIIVFTGKSMSQMQEGRLKQYVNSIVLKTAHSYQRILDEVSLFLHLAQEKKNGDHNASFKKLGRLTEVLKDKKVLIADDDVRNIFSLSKALENYGMNIISAMDGREAIEQLKKDPSIDIVLMDMMMPEMDGYESMTKIRTMPGFGKLPMIAVTAKAMAGDREKCISSGASDYITKPIDKDQLLSLLRVWLYDRIS
jgi:signal transduction histidine kinase/CHASE3 domain sensor protein/DNA-binding response OmpR family regulator